MTELTNRALLVTLNISQWTARKLDRKESAAVNAKHGTAVDAARVNKSLLPLNTELDRVHKMTSAIRNEYYQLSLPWMEGMQIIKSEGYLTFAQRMADRKREWTQAVDRFLRSYETSVDDAKHLLGTLFNESDYPAVDTIRSKFRMDVGFYPMPAAKDWRVDMADDQMDSLRKRLEMDVTEKVSQAMQAAWQRVHDVVKRIHTQTSNPEGRIYDSLVGSAKDLCAILPSLNISDDPKLEEIRQELESYFATTDAEDIRKHPEVRQEVSDQMADILAKMGGLYGA